jgi:transcription elongation factor Elf1
MASLNTRITIVEGQAKRCKCGRMPVVMVNADGVKIGRPVKGKIQCQNCGCACDMAETPSVKETVALSIQRWDDLIDQYLKKRTH